MKSAVAIVNPAAGGGACRKKAPEALDTLRAAGWKLDVLETTGPGVATDMAREAYARGIRSFIAVGGDGTSCEMINGFLPASLDGGERCSLGFLPLGTGNSFLRDFTTDGENAAIEALKNGSSRGCDVNALHHEKGTFYSMNILSMGFTARVGATTNRRFKPLGEAGYIFGVLSTLASLQADRFALTIDGQEEEPIELTLLSLNNSRFTGGKMEMAPDASTDDGFCDMIEVGKMGRFRLLQIFPRIFKGTHTEAQEVRSRKVQSIVFREPRPMDVMADGEVVRLVPHRLEVCPRAFEVVI